MRNVQDVRDGICSICHTFIDPAWSTCYACANQPNDLGVVVPITYSEHLGQMHTALRNYKDAYQRHVQAYAMVRLASILWQFLEAHERCVARAAGAQSEMFDVVVTVPSSTPERDEARGNFRWIVGEGCLPTASRFLRALRATGDAPSGREYLRGAFALSGAGRCTRRRFAQYLASWISIRPRWTACSSRLQIRRVARWSRGSAWGRPVSASWRGRFRWRFRRS
jgi:hypothetical protein